MLLVSYEEHPFALAYKLVEEGKLNPWDVDIVLLANAYMEEIKKAELLDLRIPAKAVLAASFLLKKKVQVLFPEPKKKVERKKYTLEEIVKLFEEECSPEENLDKTIPTEEKLEKHRKPVLKKVAPKKPKRYIPVHTSRFEDVIKELNEFINRGVKRFTLREVSQKKSIVPYLMAIMVLYYDNRVDARLKEDDIEVIIP